MMPAVRRWLPVLLLITIAPAARAVEPLRRIAFGSGASLLGPEGKPLQVILLDTRYFRSPVKRSGRTVVPNTDPGATILGPAQWEWLERQLREPADLRLIGSSIQVVA